MGNKFTNMFDSIKEGTKDVANAAHEKTSDFHNNYVSKVLPDCGKYGEAATFAAEMVPGVAEYNAVKDGDWQAFAIAAGIDIAAVTVGAFTAGAGYAVTKGGAKAGAKAITKAAAKEIAEEGAKKVVKETAEAGAKKVAKEVAEAGAEKVVKEVIEEGTEKVVKEVAKEGTEKVAKEVAKEGTEKVAKEVAKEGTEKVAKEVVEEGIEKVTKEVAEEGTEKVAKEIAEEGTEKVAKEVAEEGTERVAKEVAEEGTEKVTKEITETVTDEAVKETEKIESQVVKNKLDGIAREEKVFDELASKYLDKDAKVIREALLRDSNGNVIKDVVTGEARRIDYIVAQGDKVIESIEVTSETASKVAQTAKEMRILEQAKELGGAFIKDTDTGQLIKFGEDIATYIWRLQ